MTAFVTSIFGIRMMATASPVGVGLAAGVGATVVDVVDPDAGSVVDVVPSPSVVVVVERAVVDVVVDWRASRKSARRRS